MKKKNLKIVKLKRKQNYSYRRKILISDLILLISIGIHDFEKTKKGIETMEGEVMKQRNNLNAIYGAVQQTEKLLKLSRGETDGKKV